jgi:hypothetical protein
VVARVRNEPGRSTITTAILQLRSQRGAVPTIRKPELVGVSLRVYLAKGQVALDEAWGLPDLGPGRTVLLPAEIGPQTVRCVGNAGGAKLLHVALG